MDKHDEQFESYLRQFRLRQPGSLPEMASLKRRSSVRWGLAAAAAVVLVAALSIVLVRNSGNVGGPKATVEAAGNPSLYRVGETIEAGKVIRSNSAVGLLLALEDGSRVEMHAQSELKLESAVDGIRVRLNEGSILVTAAKQRAGHLYVQTRDAMVSVVGTVFFVNAEQSGTTVAVVEGEVHVQQGAELKKLLPGEQIATNPVGQPKTVAEQISWSRSAVEYVALLQQPESPTEEARSSPPEPETGGSSMALYQQAVVRFEQGDINTAVQLFRDSLNGDLNPKWLEVWAHINIGKIYDVRGGQRDRAIQEYQKAVNTGDDTYSAQDEAKKYLGAPFSLSAPTQQAVAVPYPSLMPPALLAQQQAPARLRVGVLPFKVQANYVRGTGDQVRTLITIQVMNRDLAFKDEGGGKKARAHIDGTVYRIDNRRLPGFSQDVMQEFPSNTFTANLDEPTLFQETLYLTPGKYKLHITAEDKNAQSIGVQEHALDVPRIPDQSLQASSLILASSITDLPPRALGADMFALGEKKVKPNVSGVFRTSENLNVWQEIYGLTINQATRKPSATLELVVSQNKKEITKLLSDSKEFTGSGLEFTGPGFLQMRYTNSVSLADFAPGQYDVQVKVTDNLAKVSFVTVSSFSVAAIPATQSTPSRLNAGSAIFYRACNTCHNPQVMNSQNFATKEEYAALVGREAGKGASVTRDEIPILVDYLFDTYGKKSENHIPSDIPLQRNFK